MGWSLLNSPEKTLCLKLQEIYATEGKFAAACSGRATSAFALEACNAENAQELKRVLQD